MFFVYTRLLSASVDCLYFTMIKDKPSFISAAPPQFPKCLICSVLFRQEPQLQVTTRGQQRAVYNLPKS